MKYNDGENINDEKKCGAAHKKFSIIYLGIRFAVNNANKLCFVTCSITEGKENIWLNFLCLYQRTLYEWPSPACTHGFSTVISGGAEMNKSLERLKLNSNLSSGAWNGLRDQQISAFMRFHRETLMTFGMLTGELTENTELHVYGNWLSYAIVSYTTINSTWLTLDVIQC